MRALPRNVSSPMMAASVPSDRSWVLRLESWREAGIGRLVWYAVEVGVVAGLYYGAARAGLHLAYLHGSVTALWPPVGVGMAALVILGPGVWPAIVIGDLLDFGRLQHAVGAEARHLRLA